MRPILTFPRTTDDTKFILNPVQEIVCKYYQINPELLYEKTRTKQIAEPRQVVICIGSKVASLSNKSLAQVFTLTNGNVCYANRTIWDRWLYDKSFKHKLTMIADALGFDPELLKPKKHDNSKSNNTLGRTDAPGDNWSRRFKVTPRHLT